MDNLVIEFINGFKKLHKTEIEDVFLNGYCYWFAKILSIRFDGEIYYNPVDNHFITKIDNSYYDITGSLDISNQTIYSWNHYQEFEPLDSNRVIDYCVLKIK